MKHKFVMLIAVFLFHHQSADSQTFSSGDHWYTNPLGFSPLELHAANGFLLPAAAVAACLIFTKDDTSLTNGNALYNEDGISWGYKIPHTTLFQNSTGISHALRRWMSVGLEICLYNVMDEYNNTGGVGVRPFARFYPLTEKRWRLYFESGVGIIYFFDNFPKPTIADSRLGTHWNATSKYGIGSEINLDSSTSIVIGARHVHVSNGNVLGVDRNPSHDSNGFFVGFSYRPANQ
ncbi:MAG TPA: acyloxyacyl hydrolase [Candidatus Kryptonia bacterium]